MPSLWDLILLSMIGLTGGVANLWLGQSYKYAEERYKVGALNQFDYEMVKEDMALYMV